MLCTYHLRTCTVVNKMQYRELDQIDNNKNEFIKMNLPKFCTFFMAIIFMVSQVTTKSIQVDDCNDSQSLANVTDFYEYSSQISRRYRRQNTNTDRGCEIPSYRPNSAYESISEPGRIYKPGEYVKEFSVLGVTCDNGYKLPPPFTENTSTCLKGEWKNLPPACLRACSSLMSTNSTTVKCTYDDRISLDNCIHPVDGTTVRLSCNTFYESVDINRNPIRSCNKGRWIPNLPECYATCGVKSPKGQLNLINGRNATPGDYPWQVGIYTNKEEFICGGSIIDQNIILSAAHCFTDFYGNVHPASNYLIASGKFYSRYHDDRDEFAQYSTVHRIFVPTRYKSINGLNAFDIAVVILQDPFTLTQSVQPVCIELNNEESQNTNYLTNNGTVAGWGYTEKSQAPSETLKELIIPYIPFEKCYNEVPENFRQFIMYDKICGGYLNQSTSACQGDSGGSLVYKINNQYYVKGIVSLSPGSTESGVTQCNSNQYGLYTSVNKHIDFVAKLVVNHSWKQYIECVRDDCTNEEPENSNRCRLPNSPQNGKYSFPDKNSKYEPGTYVYKYNSILLSCDTGYEATPSGAMLFICIEGGEWSPTVGTCTPTQKAHEQIQQNGPQQNVQHQNSSDVTVSTTIDEYNKIISQRFDYFDFDLLKTFNSDDENYLISSASIKLTLAMLLEGSKGESAVEISKALRISGDVNLSRGLLNNLTSDLRGSIGSLKHLLAVPNKYTVLPKFRTIVKENYNMYAIERILQDKAYSRPSNKRASRINSWSEFSTFYTDAESVREETFNHEDSLVIANSMYFRGKWKIEFNRTATADFNRSSTEHNRVKMMHANGQFRYGYIKELNAEAVELPYSNEKDAMLILLPNAKSNVKSLQHDLQLINFANIFQHLETTEMLITLPKFDINYKSDFVPMLKMLGIREIFSENANLSGIIEQVKVKVSKILYSVKVRVEQNDEDSLRESTSFIGSSSKEFHVNRPFLFFIYNIFSETILFEGRISNINYF